MPRTPGQSHYIQAVATPAAGQLDVLDENLQLVSSKPGEMNDFNIYNPSVVSPAYLKIYDANKVADVTPATDLPHDEFVLAPGTFTTFPEGRTPKHCDNGIVVSVTLVARADNSAPASACVGDMAYTKFGG